MYTDQGFGIRTGRPRSGSQVYTETTNSGREEESTSTHPRTIATSLFGISHRSWVVDPLKDCGDYSLFHARDADDASDADVQYAFVRLALV